MELTKEQYLQMRMEGKNRSSIQREYFPNNPPKFYGQLKEWGIKEKDAEEHTLDLLAAELKQSVPKTPSTEKPRAECSVPEPQSAEDPKAYPDPRDEEIARLRAELERIKADNVEAVRLSGAAAEKMQAEIAQLREQNERHIRGLEVEEAENKKLRFEIEQLKAEKKDLENLLEDYRDDVTMLTSKVESLQKQLDAAAAYTEGVPTDREHDPVNRPAHYTAGKVECIDAIESATVGLAGGQAYATGAAIKYLWRWSRKGGVEDLKKARWHVDRLIQNVDAEDRETATF